MPVNRGFVVTKPHTAKPKPKVEQELPLGPTLNPSYNTLYAVWQGIKGAKGPSECENCGADLTGKQVHDRPLGWLCTPCQKEWDATNAPPPPVATKGKRVYVKRTNR